MQGLFVSAPRYVPPFPGVITDKKPEYKKAEHLSEVFRFSVEDVFYYKQDMFGLPGRELPEFGNEVIGAGGVGEGVVKELLRGYAEVFADIEKHGHRRQGFAIFNLVDVTLALPQ